MKRRMSRRAVGLFCFVILLLLVGLPLWMTYRMVQQERRDQALIAAIRKNDTARVLSLLECGANPNATESDRSLSAWQRFTLRFRHLFNPHAKIPSKGETALLLAADAQEVQPTIVLALLYKGADVHAKDHWGDTALLALFEGRTMPGTSDIVFSPYEQPRLVQALLDKGIAINARNFNGETALTIAAGNGWTKTVRLLLEREAEVNSVDSGSPGTALSNAAQLEHTAIVKMLLARKADVNLADSSGSMPLHYAKPNTAIFRLLKRAGARE